MVDCSDVAPFFGSDLDAREAEEFRVHLAGCRRCQRKLEALMQELTRGEANKRTK